MTVIIFLFPNILTLKNTIITLPLQMLFYPYRCPVTLAKAKVTETVTTAFNAVE